MAAAESGLPKVQQEPSVALQIVVDNNEAENVPTDEPRVSSSEQSREDDVEQSWEKLSIYRIPHYLRDGNDEAFVPRIVSLGPYHHGKEHLRHMDQHKLRRFRCILERSHHERGLYLDKVKEVEQRARACYEGITSMSSDDFVEMMVLDGCFVIELFRTNVEFEELGYRHNDPIFSRGASILKTRIQRDMIMLENQISLFILDQLLSLQLGEDDREKYVVELAIQFFFPWTPFWGIMVETDFASDPYRLHCLGAYWSNILPSYAKRAGTKERAGIIRWPQRREQLNFSVTKLREAGIVFRSRPSDSLGDIEFSEGVLRIPKLMIHDGTTSLFLNMIAYKQSPIHFGNHITSYVIFIRSLVHSPEDVSYLRNRRIIEHCLGSDAEVVDLFNRLSQEVAFNVGNSYLHDLEREVLRARVSFDMDKVGLAYKWNFWAADLKKKHFNSPWSTISVIAASFLLVLTTIQTFYGAYSYYRSRRP